MPAACAYDYAVIRVVPNVEREEFVNAGVILFCRTHRFLTAAIELDWDRLRDRPGVEVAAVAEQLALLPRLCVGEGPIGAVGQAEVFHWVTAPHSTVIQCSPVHSGLTIICPAPCKN